MRPYALGGLLFASAFLAGCGGGNDGPDANPTATVSVTTTVTETPQTFESETPEITTESQTPNAPNVGDLALTVGETRVGQTIKTTLQEVKIPYPPGQYRTPEAGNVFVGLRIEQCVDADGPADILSTSLFDWSAVTPNGNEYKTGGSSWTDWPEPRFPDYVTMVPGRCVKGWLAFEVPQGTQVASVIWRPDGTTTAEWLPKQ